MKNGAEFIDKLLIEKKMIEPSFSDVNKIYGAGEIPDPNKGDQFYQINDEVMVKNDVDPVKFAESLGYDILSKSKDMFRFSFDQTMSQYAEFQEVLKIQTAGEAISPDGKSMIIQIIFEGQKYADLMFEKSMKLWTDIVKRKFKTTFEYTINTKTIPMGRIDCDKHETLIEVKIKKLNLADAEELNS